MAEISAEFRQVCLHQFDHWTPGNSSGGKMGIEFEAFSPGSFGTSSNAKLKVRLARLQLEVQEKEMVRRADYEHRLQFRKLEIEAEK
ncbi:hypothetical protein NQZ68_014271 [Dissostichus eleginoides]|nr:hypothetical protein NQZ68_014271 [Dissostichus eleginoides]